MTKKEEHRKRKAKEARVRRQKAVDADRRVQESILAAHRYPTVIDDITSEVL